VKHNWDRWSADEIAWLSAAALTHWHALRNGAVLLAPARRPTLPILMTPGTSILIRMPGQPTRGLLATGCGSEIVSFNTALRLQDTWSETQFCIHWDMYFGRSRQAWLSGRVPQVRAIKLTDIARNINAADPYGFMLGLLGPYGGP